jgi:hypothetical protein
MRLYLLGDATEAVNVRQITDFIAIRMKAVIALLAAVFTAVTPFTHRGQITSYELSNILFAVIGAVGVYHFANSKVGFIVDRYAKAITHGSTTIAALITTAAPMLIHDVHNALAAWWQFLILTVGTIGVIVVRNRTHAKELL